MRLSQSSPINIVLALAAFFFAPVGSGLAAEAPLYQFEQQAKLHCPGDDVVWVNLPAGIYNVQGERWYGTTRHGSFACRAEAEQAGYKPRNEPAKGGLPSAVEWVRWLSGG